MTPGDASPDYEAKLLHLRHQVDVMARYATETGKVIPPDAGAQIARLHVPESGTREPDEAEPSTDLAAAGLSKALEVHARLARLVAPATPLSIETTQSDSDTFLGSLLIRNPVIRLLMALTIASIFLVLFISALIVILTDYSDWLNPLLYLSAAGLGAGFYSLTTAHRYIVERTFDPQYNQIYLIRFIVGLAAGVIFALFGKELIQGGNTISALGPPVLAVVGGFAADAVAEILRRVADVLTAAVKGGAQSQIEAERARITSEEQSKHLEENRAAAKKALQLAASPNLSDVVRGDVQSLADSLLQ